MYKAGKQQENVPKISASDGCYNDNGIPGVLCWQYSGRYCHRLGGQRRGGTFNDWSWGWWPAEGEMLQTLVPLCSVRGTREVTFRRKWRRKDIPTNS